MVLDNLQSMDALFGMTQTGGKPKTRKTAKTGKTVKTVKKAVKAGTKKARSGGNDPVYFDYAQDAAAAQDFDGQVDQRDQMPPNKTKQVDNPSLTYTCKCDPQSGGMSKMQYKAYLAKMDVKRLYKIAKGKGIKITKKKDGKTTYIKKDTVIQKLCDAMHGKKK